jgi:dTDP-4-dehydrorhamnose reductase
MRIAVIGISGMLGSTAYRLLSGRPELSVYGTARSADVRKFFNEGLNRNIITGVDVDHFDGLVDALLQIRPDVVINCVGIVKQLSAAKDALMAIPINSVLPHRLARLCDLFDARVVHVSTDCVFSGRQGNYRESDQPDADDLYGRSKLLGEIDYPNAITLRTSIIGRELASRNGLLEWFLHERGRVRGFSCAIFSGLTTDELTRVIADYVLPNRNLRGVYHVSSAPINKYDLLQILKSAYQHIVEIECDAKVVIDRSLDSSRFQKDAGYRPPSWTQMIARMRDLEFEQARS